MSEVIPLPKIKAILKYFYEHTDPKFLGKVKLMKLFYYLDFTHVKRYGVPVTHDRYVNLEHGPIPSIIKNLVDAVDDNMDTALLADTISIEKSSQSPMHKIKAHKKLTDIELKYFSQSELEVLEEISRRFYDKNKQYMEDMSHNEAPWSMTQYLEEIPYELASYDKDSKVSEDDIKLLKMALG